MAVMMYHKIEVVARRTEREIMLQSLDGKITSGSFKVSMPSIGKDLTWLEGKITNLLLVVGSDDEKAVLRTEILRKLGLKIVDA